MDDKSIENFLNKTPWSKAKIGKRIGDASFRYYLRLEGGISPALLMVAPPDKEAIAPFMKIADHLSKSGLKTPKLYDYDEKAGFLIIEDFGDLTFTEALKEGIEMDDLYQQALNTLLTFQKNPISTRIELPEYDLAIMLREAMLFFEWFLPFIDEEFNHDVFKQTHKAKLKQIWQEIWHYRMNKIATHIPLSLTMRDFHVDNLMLVGAKPHYEIGILDFQDALLGSPAYDFISLIEDARRDLNSDLKQLLTSEFLECFLDQTRLAIEFDLHFWGLQRHAKVLGIFVRLAKRDHKPNYLCHLPRVWNLFQENIEKELAFKPLQDWCKSIGLAQKVQSKLTNLKPIHSQNAS